MRAIVTIYSKKTSRSVLEHGIESGIFSVLVNVTDKLAV